MAIKTPSWPVPLGAKPITLGLERVEAAVAVFPEIRRNIPPIIHVAGTNGKGSTIAFMRAILEQAGYRVHVYNSPHLIAFNERITLAGHHIDDEMLLSVLDECRIATEGMNLSFFEGTTLAALLAFSRVAGDVVLLETGLGGRLDATNIFTQPLLTILTPIGLDHQEFLGDDLASIAAEKAAIMKPNVPCIVAAQHDEALAVIQAEAARQNAPLTQYGEDYSCKAQHYQSANLQMALPALGLVGEHQYGNAVTAIAAIEQLPNFDVSQDAITAGLQSVAWPGRLQKLHDDEVCRLLPKAGETTEIWLDGGHNSAAAAILAKQCASWQSEGKTINVVLAMSRGRQSADFIAPLVEYIEHIYVTEIPDEPLTVSAHALQKSLIDLTETDLVISSSILADIGDVPYQSSKKPLILYCGSLYLVGHVLGRI